jgi:hypothetical protein
MRFSFFAAVFAEFAADFLCDQLTSLLDAMALSPNHLAVPPGLEYGMIQPVNSLSFAGERGGRRIAWHRLIRI